MVVVVVWNVLPIPLPPYTLYCNVGGEAVRGWRGGLVKVWWCGGAVVCWCAGQLVVL